MTACDIHLLIVTHHAVNAHDPFQGNDHDPKVGVQPPPPRRSHAAMDEDEKQRDEWLNNRKNRLPSFSEVLSRNTRPPVDLFMF